MLPGEVIRTTGVGVRAGARANDVTSASTFTLTPMPARTDANTNIRTNVGVRANVGAHAHTRADVRTNTGAHVHAHVSTDEQALPYDF